MNDITAPGTYTVQFTGQGGRLSSKRFRDAVAVVKGKLGGEYDAATRTWTVTLDDSEYDRIQGASHLRSLREAYSADVERA